MQGDSVPARRFRQRVCQHSHGNCIRQVRVYTTTYRGRYLGVFRVRTSPNESVPGMKLAAFPKEICWAAPLRRMIGYTIIFVCIYIAFLIIAPFYRASALWNAAISNNVD